MHLFRTYKSHPRLDVPLPTISGIQNQGLTLKSAQIDGVQVIDVRQTRGQVAESQVEKYRTRTDK